MSASLLVRLVLCLVAGLVPGLRLAETLDPQVAWVLVLGALALAALHRRPAPWRGPLAFGVLGFALGLVTAVASTSDCRALLPDGAALAAVGRLETSVRAGTAVLRLESIAVDGHTRSCAGGVRMRARGRAAASAEHAPVGPLLRAHGEWRAYPVAGAWPRPADRSGVFLVDSVATVPDGRRASPLLAVRAGAQDRLTRLLPEHGGVAEALILARREGLEPEVRERFVRAGLPHLLAISGLHVGLIAGVLLLLGRLFRLSVRRATILAGAGTLTYVLFLGAPYAAARAALQVLLVLAARLMQRPTDPFALLATAGLVILTADPLAILDPGFQLSFAGTAGIVGLRRRFLAALPEMPRRTRAAADSLATGLAATLTTSPIAVLHFGQMAPVGLVSNIVAIPLVGAAVPALALVLVLSYVSWSAAAFVAPAAAILLDAIDALALAAGQVPGGHRYVPRDAVGGWALAGVLAAWAAGLVPSAARGGIAYAGAISRAARRIRRLRATLAAAAALAVFLAWPIAAQRVGGGGLEIHAIDVGQGDAFAIRSPAGRWILVDAGPRDDRFDAGYARVVPFLLRHGVRRVEAMILTHPHADHIGGAGAVLEALEVARIVDPGVPSASPIYRELLRTASRLGVEWLPARRGRRLDLDGVTLRFLYPDPGDIDVETDPNDYSLAFHLAYAGFGALFLGDLPAAAEVEMVARDPAGLRAQVLKVGHHGSATSSSAVLLDAASPEVALIGVGRRNRYGHPHAEVLVRLEERGIHVLRTDVHGHVRVRIESDRGIVVRTTYGEAAVSVP